MHYRLPFTALFTSRGSLTKPSHLACLQTVGGNPMNRRSLLYDTFVLLQEMAYFLGIIIQCLFTGFRKSQYVWSEEQTLRMKEDSLFHKGGEEIQSLQLIKKNNCRFCSILSSVVARFVLIIYLFFYEKKCYVYSKNTEPVKSLHMPFDLLSRLS